MGFIVHECNNQLEPEGSNWLLHECAINPIQPLVAWFNRFVAQWLPLCRAPYHYWLLLSVLQVVVMQSAVVDGFLCA